MDAILKHLHPFSRVRRAEIMEHAIRLIGSYILNSLANEWWRNRKHKQREGLPLLLSSSPQPSLLDEAGGAGVLLQVLGDVAAQLLEHLHHIDKHFNFWQIRAQGAERDKVRFMVLERGPLAFLQGVKHLTLSFFLESSPTKGLVCAAATRINERVSMLANLRKKLAILIGQVHIEVAKMGEKVASGRRSRRAMSECIIAVLMALANLEGAYDLPQSDYHGHRDEGELQSLVLEFGGMSEELMRGMEWTNSELYAALDLLSSNLLTLRQFLASLMSHYKKPKKVVKNWIQYTGGALGLAIASGWLVQHSRLAGSDDLDRWISKGRQDTYIFLDEHVQQPLLSIRDDLFDTFRKRHHGSAEVGDVQLTSESLQRMIKEFVAQTRGARVASRASEQELMQMMMGRYEEELAQPVKNLLGGELARAFLIQVQKLKLDIETAMLELNQILRANEINFAILAALPALISAIILGALLRQPFNEKGAEGRGRQAQLKRRMLMVEVEKAVMTCQMSTDENREESASLDFGLLIYCLDRLHKSVKKSALASGEWCSLRNDILDLAKPRMSTYYKLAIAARMERVYDCLAPMPKW